MFVFDQVTSYLLVVALLTLLVAVLVWQRQKTQKTIAVWLAASVIGMLLGSSGSYGIMRLMGYKMMKAGGQFSGGAGGAASMAEAPTMMGGPMGMGPPTEMGGVGGMGGPRPPRPKRDLTTLVRKLDLLTGDIAISLSAEQAAALSDCLKDLEKAGSMSDDDAQAKHDEILAALDETAKAKLDAVGLPRRPRGGPGDAGGGPGGMGGPGMGGPSENELANPFAEEVEAQALNSLLERLAPKDAAGADTPEPKQ
jgi:hypothetical protein